VKINVQVFNGANRAHGALIVVYAHRFYPWNGGMYTKYAFTSEVLGEAEIEFPASEMDNLVFVYWEGLEL
jgi:hypothetical protein